MTIQRPSDSTRETRKLWRRRQEKKRRLAPRRFNLESLEDRRLMAVGPQLAGIRANDDTLLREAQVRKTAPQELTFHFNDGADIAAATVASGIRLTRSGGDNIFSQAVGTTDFNTSGQVIMDFTAVNPGESGNGIRLNFIKNDLGSGGLPRITVLGDTIGVELNSNIQSQSTAAQLRDAINNHVDAKKLVRASLRNAGGATINIAASAITYSPIITSGANAAFATTTLNAGAGLQIKLTALQDGPNGNGIEVVVVRNNFGGVAPPIVTVNKREITVTVNQNPASPTTAKEFIDAINAHPQANQLIRASINSGRPDTAIGNRVTPGARFRLSGGNRDIPIVPGFIGLGATTREVVMRFKDPLPDDLYHVEVLGTGAFALRNVAGVAFGDQTEDQVDNGVDYNLTFELNLGAQVVSVVPQPITRNPVTGTLSQARNQIHVYFNDDDLYPTLVQTGGLAQNPSVVDPAFYQLIFTSNTAQNTDDVTYRPKAIQYDPTTDLAVLQFDRDDLINLGSGVGTYRLRVGTDEARPLVPVATALSGVAQATTDFNTNGAATVLFQQVAATATPVTIDISKRDLGAAAVPAVSVTGTTIRLELNSRPGSESTAAQVLAAVNGSTAAAQLVSASLFNTPAPGNVDVATLAQPRVLTLREIGSSFDSALNLSVLGSQGQILASAITAQPYDLQFPGAIDEPGHRDLTAEVQRHFLCATDSCADPVAGITTAFYNFQDEYGFDPQGRVLHNAISESQKQRAREVFSIYSNSLGIQFIESDNLGMTIVTGDLRALNPNVTTGPGGVLGIAGGGLVGRAVMDIQDFSNPGDDLFGGAWFQTAMHEIGHLLGLGHTDELPPRTVMDDTAALAFPENTVEPIFPGAADVLHGQHLFRPDGKDIDLYRFELRDSGRLSLETMAERLQRTSLLNTVITLYRQNGNGQRELIARNDDYFSNDSYVELDLSPGTYWVGVSASGNDNYDPIIEDTGLGGRSEGNYELRMNFRPNADRALVDSTGVELDGDNDGAPGGVFNFWFRAQDASHSIFVDKAARTDGTGTIGSPFQLISTALAAAQPGDIVRIVGNAGTDQNPATLLDNQAYEIGFNRIGTVLNDGAVMDIPRDVTVMVDAGAIFKMRRARVGVGSSSEVVDRSAGSLQILGVPVQIDAFGQVLKDADQNVIPGSVIFTSLHDDEIGLGRNPDTQTPDPARGDWGGLDFRRDIDARDANRKDYEDAGIFLNHVAGADLRYGGGTVLVEGVSQVVSPINMVSARPTAMFNHITLSADAAMSATPDSFEETNFHAPNDQLTPFTSDYSRVGPSLYSNTIENNSVNGLFVRVATPAGGALQQQSVSGRWDDASITHVLAERLEIGGTPGGPLFTLQTPSVSLVTLTANGGGQLESGSFHYRVVFVDVDGNESAPSAATTSLTVDGTTAVRAIALENLPLVPANYVAKRIYRSDRTGDVNRPYSLAAELNSTSTSYVDSGANAGTRTATLVVPAGPPVLGLRPRFDARLSIDPGVVVKLTGGAIETKLGSDFYAEGIGGREVIFTSGNDDRYGAGGSFDTTDNANRTAAQAGDWGGVFIGHGTRGSFDHVVVAFGGGPVGIEGGFSSFNAIEVHQSPVRITHSLFQNNANGTNVQGATDRVGRGFNRAATIFVRDAQPIILDNEIIDNRGAAISINAAALNSDEISDTGRSTFDKSSKADPLDQSELARDNQGPLVRLNRLDRNEVNGLQVRGATLTEEGVWDDTDIVHVLRNETVYVPDLHTSGGLRLESSSAESLVVKLEGATGGITATGRPLDIDDRLGGAIHVVGQSNHPVVMSAIGDCTVGAGFAPNGVPQNDTLESNACSANVQTVTPYADIIVVMDESGSMAFAQQFSVQMITDLENALLTAGIGAGSSGGNRYGLVGFGGSSFGARNEEIGHSHPVGAGGTLFGTAAEYGTAAATLQDFGALEDGYEAMQFAMRTYQTRPDAAKFILLVTNEDRDILFPQYTFANTLAGLNSQGFILEAIVAADIRDANRQSALAIDVDDTVYLADGQGGFTTSPNGSILPPFFFDTTIPDYVDMAFATGGVAGDINQIQFGGLTATSFSQVIATTIVVRAGGGNEASPGDWNTVRLDPYSNDRNVAALIEDEGFEPIDGVGNARPDLAQFLGALAPREKAGDENLRLGFDINGGLNQRGDVDVYSFKATPGSEVWIDIDDTRNTLDTVVELVDGSGNVLARSNDSLAEAANPSLLFRSPNLAAGSVNPLRKAGYDPKNPAHVSILAINDAGTTNPRDAGMRIVLPGTVSNPPTTSTYHIRVRSNSNDLSQLAGGLTQGNYNLQVRLRELDEHPGSTVKYSDIRYANNGIEILGHPAHSPLTGEAVEVETTSTSGVNNNTVAAAQRVGNVLQTDRGALALQGDLDLPTDVDFYEVTVAYDSIQGAGPAGHAALSFDFDYGDGLARPNATLWVFDSNGRLVLRGTGSNIAEDRPSPNAGTDTADLSRGSVGTLDPFIGPVVVPAGPDSSVTVPGAPRRDTYFVAVTSNAMTSDVLQQYLQATVPAGVASVRLEPVNSVRRVAEDRIGGTFVLSGPADPPQVPILIDPTQSVVPFHLGDVSLFVTHDGGLAPQTISTLRYVDPFTGQVEATAGSFAQPLGDLAMRGDGNLFGRALGPDNYNGAIDDGTTGGYVRIDSATAASTRIGDDGVETHQRDPMNLAQSQRAGQNGAGMNYNAMTYLSTSDAQFGGYVVGTRGDAGFSSNDPTSQGFTGLEYLENILYNFDINSGAVVSRPVGATARTGAGLIAGAGTPLIEVGEILTYTRIEPQFPESGDTFTLTVNGKSISYTAGGGAFGFVSSAEVVAGLAAAWSTAALTTLEFAAFEVLNTGTVTGSAFDPTELRVRLRNSAAANFTITGTTTNGGTFPEGLFVEGAGPGGIVTGIASLDGFSFYAVTDRGGLYQVNQFPSFDFTQTGFFFNFSNNLAQYVRSSAVDLMTGENGQPISFAGLTRGPANVENGKYANMLFGISDTGRLYAFDTEGELQPIFVNNQSSVSTGLFNVNGLAFSTLDRNLWTTTSNRGTDFGHGLALSATAGSTEPFDGSRLDAQLGGTSLYFGNDRSTNTGGNQSFSNTAFVRDYNFPGGSSGSVVSNPFSLKGYAAEDLPVLYFNYFLNTEDTDYNPDTTPVYTPTRDTLRVFASGDDGEWTLLATNDLFQAVDRSDEFDLGRGDTLCAHPSGATEPCVQRLFDNTNAWRQARIPLGPLAGRENLRLRFDFSTAGDMNLGDRFTVGSELRAIAGKELRDAQTVTLDGATTLEFDLGFTLVAPNGSGILDGNSFSVTSGNRGPLTFEFDSDGSFARNIAAVAGNRLRDGDKFFVRVGNTTRTFEFDSGVSLRVPAVGGGQGGLRDGDKFSIDGVTFEFDTDGNFAAGNSIINLIVDSGIQVPTQGGGVGGLRNGDKLLINNGLGGADVIFEFDDEFPAQVTTGARQIDITNIELHLPIAGGGFGGLNDGDTFTINEGFGGPDVIFEFDKNNNVLAGNRAIPITDLSTQDEVANATIIALQVAGIGLKPTNQGGGVVRLGIFRHFVDTTTSSPRIVSRRIEATQNEITSRLYDSILNSGLGLAPTNAGGGLIRLGSTLHKVNVLGAPSLQYRLLPGSQNEVANLIVVAISSTALPATPLNLGNGEVFLGRNVTTVNTTAAPTLTTSGLAGVQDATATRVGFTPQDTAGVVANSISTAINGAGLGLTTTADLGVVRLPNTASFSPNGTALIPDGVRPVVYSKTDAPETIAMSMEAALTAAFAPTALTLNLNNEANDTLATATNSGITGGPTDFRATGILGDNPLFSLRGGLDVDFVRMDLQAGDRVTIDVTTPATSTLAPGLRLFNSNGQELDSTQQLNPFANLTAFNFFNFFNLFNFGVNFQPQPTTIEFNAVTSGTYYVAVSGDTNFDYNPKFDGSADVTLQVPVEGGAIGGLTDGENFTITPSIGAPVIFEFDADNRTVPGNVRISLNDVLLQVPASGIGVGGIQDGNTFTINDGRGGGDVRFEFDTNGITSPATIPIFISPFFATPVAIAQSMAIAIQGANLGLNPQVLGNGAVVLGATTHVVDTAGTPALGRAAQPHGQQVIATLIRDAIRNARLGIKPTLDATTFDIQLDIRDQRVDTTLAPNLTLVTPSSTGAYNLSINVENPFNVERDGNRLNLDATNVTRSGLTASFISGAPGVTQTTRTPIHVDSAMTSAEVAEAVANAIGRATAGYVQQVVAADGTVIQDGEIFSIGDGTTTVNFEFDSGYSLHLPDLATDPNAYLDNESFTITTSGAVTTFEFDNNGTTSGGSLPIRFNDVLLQLPTFGVLFGGVQDGNTIAIDQGLGTPPDTFEFDTDGVIQAGNKSISITANATQNEVANALVMALRTANIGLSPVNRGQGQVQLGITTQTVDVTNTPSITRRTVLLSQAEMSAKVAKAIVDSGIGMTPIVLGGGVIHLGGNATQVIDVSGVLCVTVSGAPGARDPNAVVMPIFPSASTSSAQVSQLMQSAINTAVTLRGLRVTATPNGARRINLTAPNLTTEFTNAPSLSLNEADESVKTYDNIVKVIGHSVTNRGPLGLEESLAGDFFGAFSISGPPNVTNYPGALRGLDNAREGVYIDDIIIGFAERGEMITGAPANSTFVTNNELINVNLPASTVPHREITVGPYQLEVRRAEGYSQTFQDPTPEILLISSIDTNDRLAEQVSLLVSAGSKVADGQTLTISDGLKTQVFEFVDADLPARSPAGRIPISYRASDSDVVLARKVRDAINGAQNQQLLAITAALTDGGATGTNGSGNRVNLFGNASITLQDNIKRNAINANEPSDTLAQSTTTGIGTDGVTTFTAAGNIGDNAALTNVGSDVDLFSMRLEAGETVRITTTARPQQVPLDSILRVFSATGVELASIDGFFGFDPSVEFTAPARGTYYVGVSGYSNYFYSPLIAGSGFSFFGGTFSTGPYDLSIEKLSGSFRVEESESFGDQNVTRDQGTLLIESNRITHSRGFGILADSGSRDGAAGVNASHQGPVRLTRELNTANLVPGMTIANNVLARNASGGIRFSGDVNTSATGAALPLAPIPFGKIVNNTIVGGTVGITVDENAGPTLLNNILSNVTTGISVDASSTATTIVGGTVYHRVPTPATGVGTGTFPIALPDTAALFVNENVNNFYLAPGSLAIDSSINSVPDRPEMKTLRAAVGYSESPIVAPGIDSLGQTRVDDPTVNTPPGQGSNVFIDRGAIDRADFNGPTAILSNPADNDPQNRDRNRNATFVELTSQILDNFSIQIRDGLAPSDAREGSGADDNTVKGNRVTLFRDKVKLVEGLDYTFHYDTTNNIIRLQPLAGIWELDREYEIVLSNSRGVAIDAPNGTQVKDGDTFRITDKTGKQANFEFDSGYQIRVPQTLALQIPATGGAGITDGQIFTITDGTRTERFEFDSNGATGNDSVPPPTQPNLIISFTTNDSANDIANKIVAAIRLTSLGLMPVNVINSGGRAVHLGSESIHAVDTSLAPNIRQTGVAAGLEDGQTFTIDDGTKVVTFRFVEGIGGTSTTTSRIINFSQNLTNDQIADFVVTAIKAANVSLNPTHVANSDGLIQVGGTIRHLLANVDSKLTIAGQPGVTPAWSLRIPQVAGKPDFNLIRDGQTFVVRNGTTVAATFEFDSDGRTTPGNRVLTFNANSTTAQLANAIAIAIRNANLGLSPSNAGDGYITLAGTSTHSVDLTLSALTQVGTPGIAANEPVAFTPGDFFTPDVPARTPIFTEQQMATVIAAAINNAKAKSLFDKDVAAVAVDKEVQVEGVVDISGVTSLFRSNVTDIAGNSLKPNRADGTTKFTIFIGSGLDFGDAPTPYPTTEAQDGARHQIVGDFYLGSSVDIDFDGQPSVGATGDDSAGADDEDGIVVTQTLTGSYGGAIRATASAAGFLDAWIDYNQDGDWSDVGEQLLSSRQLAAGANDITVNVLGTAKPGNTTARFRFSSRGGLAPTGFADDGEVEDHVVTIVGNPWHNAANGLDVDKTGFVVPLDALIVINAINAGRVDDTGRLPNPPVQPFVPPPFLDVNGDGFLTAQDVLLIVNHLNSLPSSEGEASATFDDLANTDASVGDPSSLATAFSAVAIVDPRVAIDDGEDLEDEDLVDVQVVMAEESELTLAALAGDAAHRNHESPKPSLMALLASAGQPEGEADSLFDMLANDTALART